MTNPRQIATPDTHRLEADLRVCDPDKVDQTHPIEAWRVERMKKELTLGFEFVKGFKLAASIFGSSRMKADSPWYEAAADLAHRLSESGFTIITGGAAGIMEAANKGAYDAKGESVGLNIRLPQEQAANKYLTKEMNFNYFFTRKVMLAFASEVYIYFPGGYGTLNEFLEILTLVQTKKIKPIPIVLYGKEYWQKFLSFFKDELSDRYQTIDRRDLDLFVVVDSVDEAYDQILKLVKC